MKKSLLLLGATGTLFISGCSSLPSMPSMPSMPSLPSPAKLFSTDDVFAVEVPVKPGSLAVQRSGRTLNLNLAEFADARGGKPGRNLGDIKAPMRGSQARQVLLDQDPQQLLGSATRAQLAADGFRLVASNGNPDFTLSGTIKTFTVNIAERDERTISLEATLREGVNGAVIWSGIITEKDDRFAGVSGNSRSSIAEYAGEGVSEFSAKVSAVVREALVRAYPQTMAATQAKPVSTIPGVTTLQDVAVREKSPEEMKAAMAAAAPQSVVMMPAPAAPTAAPAPAPAPIMAVAPGSAPAALMSGPVGYLQVRSTPAKAKVYVDDVYFGMTPLKVELPVGVNLVHFKLPGYKTQSEKVSVRKGATTEIEVKLEK